MVANHPRAKMGDPVKVVTNDEGNIWIGDLNGWNCNSVLQMVRRYLTVHYNPSHMHLSDAMELLNFWKECQESHPNDIFAFQKWLDQVGNLQFPSDGSTLPLQIAKKWTTQSQKALISADESTDNQNDNTDTEDEATSTINVVPVSSRGKSHDTHHLHKKTPMPVTAELPDASGYMDDDEFDSVPFTDVHTTHSVPSGQHQKGRKLKSALKGHSSSQGPSTEVPPWKSPQVHQAPLPANANTPSSPQKKMCKHKPLKSGDTSKMRHSNI
ncbi:hypothetical protein EDD16DRAFT_1527189 [Pisolithus croceorrhizus]|nr:hypothetical protein EV401DRAFT_1895554 [Pisolithus croceorrhizus]KAI6098418.1 hypothetical protein EDD16DRAFT_1527189 [Pisolithus croceorrhizus]KAI6167876.1 hypothetical protein EDD17DRAFT_1503578 [Pisolithus thermaeus]